MKSVTRVSVSAAAEEVWPWVAHPGGMARWNEKMVEHDAAPLEDLGRGSRFRVTYRMSGPPVAMWAEITEWDPPRAVAVRYRSAEPAGSPRGLGPDGWAEERVELADGDGGCRVTRTVLIHDRGLPWPVRVLAGLLLRFGRAKEGTHLDRLKELVEEGVVA